MIYAEDVVAWVGTLILSVMIIVVVGGLGYLIYSDVQHTNVATAKCSSVKGLYHDGVCYEITGRVIR